MDALLLKFGVPLDESESRSGLHGPLFYRWLPDGEKDAITLNTIDKNAKLKVWFERYGFEDGGVVTFDYGRREVPPDIVPTVGVLDGGPLHGLLELRSLSEERLDALRSNKIGDENYVALGKYVVKLLFPPIANFINILRVNYGQYWIENLEPWDSRKESLGWYCGNKIQIRWSLDGGKNWQPFRPDQPSVELTTTLQENYLDYISEQDWQDLRAVCGKDYTPSVGAFALCRANEFLDKNDLRYALIDGVTALEIGIHEYVRNRLPADNSLHKELAAFWNLPLRAQLISLGLAIGKAGMQEITDTIEAIKLRHDLIHEGIEPSDAHRQKIIALLKTASTFMTGPSFRLPTANPGNRKMTQEGWAELEKRLAESKG